MTIACDHISFTKDGKSFSPNVCDDLEAQTPEGFNGVTVRIDCSPESELKWEGERQKAESLAQQGFLIFWDLDFGFEVTSFVSHDPVRLSACSLAVESFVQQLYEPLANETFGVNLYRGPIVPSLQGQFQFDEWCYDYPSLPFAEKFYAVEILSEVLHRLAAILPDEALPFALFEASEPPALMAQLLSREHFSHIFVGVKGSEPLGVLEWSTGRLKGRGNDVETGVVVPLTSYCSEKSLKELETCMSELKAFRITYESHLTESWDELESLVLFSKYVSAQGQRKVLGFEAAGGEIIKR